MTTSRPLQDRLTVAAFDLHRATLEADGTVLSQEHATALLKLMNTYSRFALDPDFTGRPCFGIPLGGGKSTSIAAWIAAAFQLGLFDTSEGASGITVSIATSKVEDICLQKRRLLALGVAPELVGLQHGYDHARGEAIEPHTNGQSFPIQLVTHYRARGEDRGQLFTHHEGTSRSLMVFDEAFFPSSSLSVGTQDLIAGANALVGIQWVRKYSANRSAAFLAQTELLEALVQFLAFAQSEIGDAYHRMGIDQSAQCFREGIEVDTILARYPGETVVKNWVHLLNQRDGLTGVQRDAVAGFLDMCHEPLRVLVADGTQGLVTVRLVVDDSLNRLVVLDATTVIRDLPNMDPMHKAMGSEYQFANYPDLHIFHHQAPGGRDSMEKSFRGRKDDAGAYALEVRDMVAAELAHDPLASILICTVKERTKLIAKEIRDTLTSSGVDLDALVYGPVLAFGRKRIQFLHYGMETGTNGLEHTSVVIAAGVMYRQSIDLAGQIKAAKRDRAAPTPQQTIYSVQESEIAHQLAQLAGRSAIRVIQDGKAGGCRFHFLYKDKPGMSIRTRLEKAFPGCVYHPDEPLYGHIRTPTPVGERSKKAASKTSELADC